MIKTLTAGLCGLNRSTTNYTTTSTSYITCNINDQISQMCSRCQVSTNSLWSFLIGRELGLRNGLFWLLYYYRHYLSHIHTLMVGFRIYFHRWCCCCCCCCFIDFTVGWRHSLTTAQKLILQELADCLSKSIKSAIINCLRWWGWWLFSYSELTQTVRSPTPVPHKIIRRKCSFALNESQTVVYN